MLKQILNLDEHIFQAVNDHVILNKADDQTSQIKDLYLNY